MVPCHVIFGSWGAKQINDVSSGIYSDGVPRQILVDDQSDHSGVT